MSNSPSLTALAEAVADGAELDWSDWANAESSPTDPSERELFSCLFAAAAIGRRMASRYTLSQFHPAVEQRLESGETWGGLRIVEHVGRGRFGDVYRAYDPSLDREVALKILQSCPEVQSDGATVVHEGRMMARVRHPNVVTIYGAQTINRRTGLWMEFVEGRTLAAEVHDAGPLDPAEVVGIGLALCDAVGAVHAAGLVHRDVKALNVMRDTSGRIVLGDFGTGQEVTDVLPEGLAGTPAYLAPELFAGGRATPRSDIYSLGTLLYFLLSGTYPVRADTLKALRQAHGSGQRRPIRTVCPTCPAALARVIDRATLPDPAERFDTIAEMRRALHAAAHRRPVWHFAVAAAICAVLVAGFWYRNGNGAQAPPAQVLLLDVAPADASEQAISLTQSLERALTAAGATVVPRTRIEHALRLMRRSELTVTDPGTGREIALRLGGVHAILKPAADLRHQEHTSIDILTPSDGTLVASVRGDAHEGGIRTLAEQVVTTVRQRPDLFDATAGYPEVTTSSLRALMLMSEAKDWFNNDPASRQSPSTPERVEVVLRRALEEDPEFAMAHLMLADSLRYQGRVEDARPHLELARRYVARNVESEYLYVTGMSDHLEGILAAREDPARIAAQRRAASAFEALLRLQPDEWIPHLSLLRTYRELYRHAEADALQLRLSDLRPNLPGAQARGAAAAIALGDIPKARQFMARLKNTELTFGQFGGQVPWLRLFDGHVAWLEFDPAGVHRVADSIQRELPAIPLDGMLRHNHATQLHWLYLSIGRTRDAERAAAYIQPSARPGMLGRILSQRGDLKGIKRLLQDVQVTDLKQIEQHGRLASLWIEVGEPARAEEILRQLPGRYLYEGQLALAQGRLDEAITSLRAVHDAPESPANPLWRGEIPRNLAAALVRSGRTDDAIGTLEAASAERGLAVSMGSSGYEWIRVVDDLALLYRRVGRTEDAERLEGELRRLLALADADHVVKRRLDAVAQGTTR